MRHVAGTDPAPHSHASTRMQIDWLSDPGLSPLPGFVTALVIGLLLGVERERNPTAKAGLRTFALVSLSGAAAEFLGQTHSAPSIVAIGLGAVAFAIIAAYYHHHEETHERDPGTTTIVALIVCYLLGALSVAGHARLAVILSILTTVLLYFKAEMSGAVRGLERRDLVSILQFALVTFVVLPILPDRGYGPYAAFNPRQVWLMVVLISTLSLAGYVALRFVGATRGAFLVGALGGMVSSTATTLSYSRIARDAPDATELSATAVVTANLILPVRLMAISAVVAPDVIPQLTLPLGMALAAGMLVYFFGSKRRHGLVMVVAPDLANPVQLRTALGFATVYAVILLLLAWLGDVAGNRGVYGVALVSGLTDVDAVTLSGLRMYGLGSLSAAQVAASIVIAMSANAFFKVALLRNVGGAAMFRRCYPAIVAMVAGAVAGVIAT